MLGPDVYAELDERLAPVDAQLRRRYPGGPAGRQPVHTVYVPADVFHAGTVSGWGTAALAALDEHPPSPIPPALQSRVIAKLHREPVEDLRIDFEDGYGVRDDATEDAAARAAARALLEAAARAPQEAAARAPQEGGTRALTAGGGQALTAGGAPPFVGIRCKSLEASTRHRAIRTVDIFLDTLGGVPDGFVLTLPKVSAVEQVAAMTVLCGRLSDRLRFEVQIETPQAILGADGTATVARFIDAAGGRLAGLHYGTYDYSAACGVAAGYQALDHPVADHAKAVMQVAAAGTGVRLSDGSTNVLPVGDTEAVQGAWRLHAGLVRRSLERGFYQGWDLHPAQLPTRYAATYAFFRDGAAAAVARLDTYLRRRAGGALDTGGAFGANGMPDTGVPDAGGALDEPATARALAGFLLRGLDCGALDPAEVPFDRPALAAL